MERFASLGADLPQVCRLGLAGRGNTALCADDVHHAIERGVNYLNWCGKPDGLSQAVSELGGRRRNCVVAAQLQARDAGSAERELDGMLAELKTDYLDIATLYYVESDQEWRELTAPGGVWEALDRRKRAGRLGLVGLTSHQRLLAAAWAQTGLLDLLMIRYNAAHRGAEQEIFPVTRRRKLPVVTFTGLRWRALLEKTRDDPPGFQAPTAPDCYRFCLAHPDVAVALTAPGDRSQLDENLSLLDDWQAPSDAALEALRAHGDRVKRNTGVFW